MPTFVAEPLPAEIEDAQLAPRPILIIEDDESIAEVLSIRLEQQGYGAHIAHSGTRGLALAQTINPQVVLLDLELPDLDGLTVCQQLDENPATVAIPKIILSGRDGGDIVRRARAAGCQFYVRKPYDPNALLVLIQQAIRDANEAEFG